MLKKTLFVLLVILIIIQFIRPARNISNTVSSNDITLHFPVPEDVLRILKRSCYDCHSNNTAYPWYTNLQPVGWWLQYHINGGKRHLNYSEFSSYPVKKQYDKFKATVDEIKKGGMPLDSYLWIHKYAILTAQEKVSVIKWADSLQADLRVKNNLKDEPGQ
jgi:Haem-binding domain